MDEKVLYWLSTACGALAILLLVLNIALVNGDRRMQMEINQRASVINRGVTLSQANQGLVQALADAAVKDEDDAIKDLLAAQGITIKPKTEAKKTK